MLYLAALILATASYAEPAQAQSKLLESVKRNPEEATALCKTFRDLNAKGISATSQESLNRTSKKRNLSQIDSEILSIYVIGLHCPDVR